MKGGGVFVCFGRVLGWFGGYLGGGVLLLVVFCFGFFVLFFFVLFFFVLFFFVLFFGFGVGFFCFFVFFFFLNTIALTAERRKL